MRGSQAGALDRTYLHSSITEGLWCAVAETACLFDAKLAHAMMLSSLYGNPSAKLDDGNDQVHEMYMDALYTIPYIKAVKSRQPKADDSLIAEWRRLNEEEAQKKAAERAGSVREGDVDGR